MIELARSAQAVPHSRIRELAEIALNMKDVYKLYFGESNLPTPAFIKQAAEKALADGFTFYSSNAGLPSTRAAIAEYYSRVHRVHPDPGTQIVVTASGVQALNVAMRCILDPGDEAIVLTPAWPNGSAIVQMCNAVCIQQPLVLQGRRFTVDFEALQGAITPRTRFLLVTSPSNPLGWVATAAEQHELLEFARRHKLWLMADEVYDRLNYPAEGGFEPAPSFLTIAEPSDAVIVVQSFSKTWCMTGWRLGWIIAPAGLAGKAIQLNEFIISHAASFAQKAAETALEDGEPSLREMLVRLRENRDFVAGELRTMPALTVPDPEGAFYLFPRVEGLTDSFDFCKRLLLEKRVGLAPGVAFGAGGEGSVRICYAAERSILEPAMELLREFLQQHQAVRHT